MTTTYCYDAADRLVTTTEAGVGAIAYDGHGNTTGIWGETRRYDATDRYQATTKGATTVTYQRDGADRIIARTSTAGGGSEERYGYTGGGYSADLVLDATGAVVERTIALAGGALLTRRGADQVWSLPNLHGDTTVVTDAAGVVAGPTRTYDDPSGDTTGQPLVDNSAGLMDYAWLGQPQRPIEHETGLAPTIEMGARQYDPTLSRFLEVDPVEGGSANDYDYTSGDPVNGLDLDGLWRRRGKWRKYRSFSAPFVTHGCVIVYCYNETNERQYVYSKRVYKRGKYNRKYWHRSGKYVYAKIGYRERTKITYQAQINLLFVSSTIGKSRSQTLQNKWHYYKHAWRNRR